MQHIDVIRYRLSRAKARMDQAGTEREKSWFQHEVQMIEKELHGELAFLGRSDDTLPDMSDDEIMQALLE